MNIFYVLEQDGIRVYGSRELCTELMGWKLITTTDNEDEAKDLCSIV